MMVSVRLDNGTDVVVRAPTRPEFGLGDRVGVTYSGGAAVAFA